MRSNFWLSNSTADVSQRNLMEVQTGSDIQKERRASAANFLQAENFGTWALRLITADNLWVAQFRCPLNRAIRCRSGVPSGASCDEPASHSQSGCEHAKFKPPRELCLRQHGEFVGGGPGPSR